LKVSTNFYLSEFIDPDTYKRFGDSSIWFIDPQIIQVAQFIRTRFARSVTINGGGYKYSGFRPPACKIGAKLSQHRFGRAIDIKTDNMPEIYQDILSSSKLYMKVGLTTIENIEATPTWLHLDCRWTKEDQIRVVNP
jgi:hypothetical protein